MIRVAVTDVQNQLGSTVAIGVGYEVETGDRIEFAGDWRPMRDIAYALAAGEHPIAEVPGYAVRRRNGQED